MPAFQRAIPLLAVVFGLVGLPPSAPAQEYKVEALKEAPPEDLAAAIRETLQSEGYRVLDDEGNPFVDLWFRNDIPTQGKPGGPQAGVLFPFLKVGDLLGAARFAVDGYDYRDQWILPGTYSIRYGNHPVDGDHQGVSAYRDFALLIPAEFDQSIDTMSQSNLEGNSTEASGTTHPAVFMFKPAPSPPPEMPAMVHDEGNDLWGVVAPISLKVEGESEPTDFPIQLIVVGGAPL